MMVPTALSGFVEQVSKLGFGLFFASRFIRFGLSFGVLGAVLGVSVSELVSLVFMFIYYLATKKKLNAKSTSEVSSYKVLSKRLLSVALPITFGGLAYPIVSIIEAVVPFP